MRKKSLNPARLVDALGPSCYLGWGGQNERRERDKRVRWLRKKARHDARAQAIADQMEACTSQAPCKSAACPMCAGAAQRLASRATRAFLQSQPDQGEIVCVTIVTTDGMCQPSQLLLTQHRRILRRWRDRIGRSGVDWFVGAVDFSYNEHGNGRYPAHWSVHLVGFTHTDDPVDLKQEFLQQFPRSDAVPRPVKVKPWDGDILAGLYTFKADFRRQIGKDDGQRFIKATGDCRTCRGTDKQPLRSAEKLELLLHLEAIGLQGRLFTLHAQFLNLKRTGPTFVKKMPPTRRRRWPGP